MILGVLLEGHAWTMKVYVTPPCARGPRERGTDRVGGHGEPFPDACACLDASEREGNRFTNFYFSDENHDFGRFSENP